MRFKQHFTIYPRKTKTGIVWYYRTYDENGNRTAGTSTGLSSRTKAIAFCEDLFKDGKLTCSDLENHSLSDFITDFFADDSKWVQNKKAEGTKENPSLANNTLVHYRTNFNAHIYPFFKDIKIKDLSVSKIKEFRNLLISENLNRSSINTIMAHLNVVLNALVEDKILEENPAKELKQLKTDSKKRASFTLQEAKLLLNSDKWQSQEGKLASIIACMTGMRLNEIRGLNKNAIYEDYIECSYQFDSYDKQLKKNKTKQPRKIPICKEFHDYLISQLDNKGELFHYCSAYLYKYLVYLMDEEGMHDRRTNDGLVFHSWRHFYNTYLLAENVAGVKVDFVIGHSSGAGAMQKLYTNWDITHFDEVIKANEKLWNYLFKE